MRLVSLNTWGATEGQVFFDFIKEQAKGTEIFCFQEIFSAQPPAPQASSGARMYLFEELTKILPEFKGIFCKRSRGYDFNGKVDFPVLHGLAVFIKNSISVIAHRPASIGSLNPNPDPIEGNTIAQGLDLAVGDKQFCVINYHGPALTGDKLDTPQRLGNSEELKVTWQGLPAKAKILCGDFNLMPQAQSIKILEDAGLKNLIKEFNIANTRNEISWKRFDNKQCFADFTFVSPEVKVLNFEVPYNLVSDHLPMILTFDL